MGKMFLLHRPERGFPSFPIGLVKTGSDFIVRSVETGLGRWRLVVAVISVDTYPLSAFSELTYHLDDTRIVVFWLHCATWLYIDQTWKQQSRGFYSYFWWCGYFWNPWVPFATTGVLSEGHKNYFKDWCLKNSQPTFLFEFNFF